jgi:PAS domain S-box-containing protein
MCFGYIYDITDEKSNISALEEKSAAYEKLFEESPDGVILLENGRFTKLNKTAIKLFKINDLNELTNKGPSELSPTYQPDGILSEIKSKMMIEKSLKEGIVQFEWVHRAIDGTEFTVEVVLTPIVLNNKNLIYSTIRDISIRKEIEKNARESDKRYRLLADNMLELIALHDKDGKYIYLSPSVERILGYTPNELIGHNPYNYFHPDDIENIIKKSHQLSLTGISTNSVRYRIRHKNGHYLWFETGTNPIINESNSTILLTSSKDITKQVEAEIELKKIAFDFEKVFNGTQAAMFLIEVENDGTYRYRINNKQHIEKTGINLELLRGKTPFELLGEDLAKTVIKNYDKCLELNTTYNYEEYLELPNGGNYWLTSLTPVFENSKVRYIVGSSIDISKRIEAEKTIIENKQLTDTIINNAPIAFWLVDINNRILNANDYFIKNTNHSKGKISLTEDELQRCYETNFIAYNQSEPYFSEEQLTLTDGKKHTFQIIKKRFNDLSGNFIGILIIGLDISIRKDLTDKQNILLDNLKNSKELLEKSLEEKNELIDELITVRHKLLNLNNTKDLMFSIIAHDLRGPISGFISQIDLLIKEIDTFDKYTIQEYSLEVKNTAEGIYNLLENLLEWARFQRELIPFNPEFYNLGQIIKNNISLIEMRTKEKNITVHTSIMEVLEIYTDLSMLNTVFRNLLSNAVKFTPNNGSILVSCEVNDDKNLVISISDNGIGMDKVLLDNLFNIEYKTSRLGTNGEISSGLGLILCKDFTEKLGGRIDVESNENTGSIFKIIFPYTTKNQT